MSSTVRQVLNTPELLESILLWVEPRTLLVRCNLVCQQWHDAISTSPSLQQTLFFAPRLDCTPHFNPILSQDFSIFFDGEYHSLRDFDSLRIRGKGQRSAFMRQEASWRRMLVKQPPIERIGVLFWTGRDLEASEVYGAIYSPLRKPKSTEGGITMSVLYDRIVNHPARLLIKFRLCWDIGNAYGHRLAVGSPPRDSPDDDTPDEQSPLPLSELLEGYDSVIEYHTGRTGIGSIVPPDKKMLSFWKKFSFPGTPNPRELARSWDDIRICINPE